MAKKEEIEKTKKDLEKLLADSLKPGGLLSETGQMGSFGGMIKPLLEFILKIPFLGNFIIGGIARKVHEPEDPQKPDSMLISFLKDSLGMNNNPQPDTETPAPAADGTQQPAAAAPADPTQTQTPAAITPAPQTSTPAAAAPTTSVLEAPNIFNTSVGGNFLKGIYQAAANPPWQQQTPAAPTTTPQIGPRR